MSASSEYWKNREERQKRLYQISEDEYQARVKDVYDNMVVNINKEIYGFYGKYAKGEGIPIEEARKRISRLDMDEYKAKAKKYVKERDFSKQANEELRLYNTSMKINRLELLKANIGLEMVDGFDQLQKEFDADLNERAYKELRRQAGILGKSVENTAQKATSIVNASFANATFSDRIWMYQGMMKDRLSTLLTQGLVQGKSSILLAKDLTKAFGVSRSDAERLMRTELARVQTAAQEESYKAAGVDQYEYIGGQPNVCPICAELDGKRFPVKAMMPGTNAPPMHPNCKCSTAAWVGREIDKKRSEEERNRGIRLGEEQSFEQYGRNVKAYAVNNSGNNLYLDENLNLTRKEIRYIDGNISSSKELLGITNECNVTVVITNNRGRIASYNPKTNVLFIDEAMKTKDSLIKAQNGYAAQYDERSSIIHELFHWEDAEAYRREKGNIEAAGAGSEYLMHINKQAEKELLKRGIDNENAYQMLGISRYAFNSMLANDYDEVYTELRTVEALRGE